MKILGDPEQGVQIAQAALALLDVGLDHEPAGPGLGVALIPLLQLGGDELRGRAADHLIAKALAKIGRQGLIAGEAPRLQDRGADGDILARELDALGHRARGVADLEAQIPQGVEHEFDHALGVGRLLVGPHE